MKEGVIKSKSAKLYLKDSDESEISDEILYGMTFQVIDKIGHEWLYINTEYDYKGYINRKRVLLDSKLCREWHNDRNCVVINNFADILKKAKIQSTILITLPRGAYLYKTGMVSLDKTYSEVKLVDGTLGWIKSEFIREIRDFNLSEESFRENLVSDSLLYLGTQYRWGAKTPEGIDCSGLTSIVYMLNGVKIYRDAAIEDGFPIKKIDILDLLKGDLLYFPGHVALYIGNNKYVHASNTNNVVSVNSLNPQDVNYRDDLANSILYVGSLFEKKELDNKK